MKLARLAFATLVITASPLGAATPPSVAPAAATDLPILRGKAERGDSVAQYNLGLAHLQGRQTPVDAAEAFVWLTLAAEAGTTGPALETAREKLTVDQLAAARRRVEALRAVNPALRPAAANTSAPVIAAPASSKPASSGTPVIAVPPPSSAPADDVKRLQDQLAAAEQDKRQLSTELSAAWKDIEKLQGQLANRGAGNSTDLANAALAKQASELTKLQAQLAAASDATAALERERAALAASQSATNQLKGQITDLTSKNDALTREANDTRAELATARRTLASGTQAESQLAGLRTQIGSLERDLQAAKNTASTAEAEKTKSETALNAANQKLADATKELVTVRQRADESGRQLSTSAEQKLAALQTELSDTKAKLASAEKAVRTRDDELSGLRTALNTSQSRPTVSPADLESARREATEAKQRLADASQEITALRNQAAATRDLEARVHQLETEKAALASRLSAAEAPAMKEESARPPANPADAENKLATALRSFTIVASERDELRARVADLSTKLSAATDARDAAEAQAKTATASASASVAASAELETLRVRAATAERAAENARTDLEHANQLLAAYRPGAVQPTRPTAPPGEAARTHTIAPGETLSSISQRYYGTPNRWPEILAANRDVLPDERSFVAGRTLRIP